MMPTYPNSGKIEYVRVPYAKDAIDICTLDAGYPYQKSNYPFFETWA